MQSGTMEDNCENISEAEYDNLNVENDKLESVIIKPINRDAVHRICSGQVILNLSMAVKELVENAIDAEASNIEVRIRDYGRELVEVIDNGHGVLEENFAGLTLKYYTSKLKDFKDLESIGSLGFRGEALSSLCALSNLSITTKHSTANTATKIEYDHSGKIIKQAVASRSDGTTVTISNLFSTLPVRLKEFMKNLKREFNKMCRLLYAYCLVCVNIKITCSHIDHKNSKTSVMATPGSSLVKENIINIFGAKQISTLVDISVGEPNEAILGEYGLSMTPKEKIPFSFEGFISSVVHGHGRSTSDRQFYYINSRPCEPTKVMKLVNEIYRQFNINQYPFVYLNILIDKKHIDVNVTPDKRQVFLDNEKLVLAVLKSSLLDAFKEFPSRYTMQNLNITQFKEQTSFKETSKGLKRLVHQDGEVSVQASLQCQRKKLKRYGDEKIPNTNLLEDDTKTLTESVNDIYIEQNIKDSISKDFTNKIESKNTLVCKYVPKKERNLTINETTHLTVSKFKKILCSRGPKNSSNIENLSMRNNSVKNIQQGKRDQLALSTKSDKLVVLNTSIDTIQENMQRKLINKEYKNSLIKFRSEINPDCNAQAEQELQKQITTDKFKDMKVVGQFNLAFIIARLENDLFIIDQHASDEKYNFEQLQMNTILKTQVLVTPKELDLTAANEDLLIENENIFRKNGFIFSIDHTAAATKKVKLLAIPVSGNYSFEKEDIEELLFMLEDGNDTMCRPSKIRQMLASRACRKSIMVGKPLSGNDMKKLVDHMGEIDQPWNCPHGRPTMRHLINLSLIQET